MRKIAVGIVAVVVALGVMIGGWIVGQYNRIITMDEQVKRPSGRRWITN
ncbi:MAG: hypothetical protein U0411_13200 [Thermodesulfovibrionales bacterium]